MRIACATALIIIGIIGTAWGRGDDLLRNILRFANEISWPADDHRQPYFTLEFVGTDTLVTQHIARQAPGVLVKGKPLRVLSFPTWRIHQQPGDVNVVYVGSESTASIPEVYEYFRGRPVLIITEHAYHGPGWMVIIPQSTQPAGRDHGAWVFSFNPSNIAQNARLSLSERLTRNRGEKRQAPPQPSSRFRALQEVEDADEATLQRQLTAKLRELIQLKDTLLYYQRILIGQQRDTIHYQDLLIDSLNMLDFLSHGLIGGNLFAPTRGRRVLSAEARARIQAQASLPPQRRPLARASVWNSPVWTAPWNSTSAGGVVLLTMLVTTLTIALLVYWYSSESSHSDGGHRYEEQMAAGGIPLGATEQTRRRDVEIERLRAYNLELERQIGERRQEYDTMLQEANSLAEKRRNFLSNLSHELRTPLNCIVGLTQYLEASQEDDSEVQEILNVINENAYGLMRMMNGVMTFTTLHNSPQEVPAHDYPVREMFTSLEESLSSRTNQLPPPPGGNLEFHIQDAVPPNAPGDGEKVRTLLELLLTSTMAQFPAAHHTCGCYLEAPDRLTYFVQSSTHDLFAPDGTSPQPLLQPDDAPNNLSNNLAMGLAELLETSVRVTSGEGSVRYQFSFPLT